MNAYAEKEQIHHHVWCVMLVGVYLPLSKIYIEAFTSFGLNGKGFC